MPSELPNRDSGSIPSGGRHPRPGKSADALRGSHRDSLVPGVNMSFSGETVTA